MGTPLRGIDVKLGKNPSGNAAARATTDDAGNFAFPIVPQGSYTLTFTIPKETDAKMNIRGAVHGPAGRIFYSEVAFQVKVVIAPAPIILESDGKTPFSGRIITGPQSADSDDERE